MWAGDGCNISEWGRTNAVGTPVLEYESKAKVKCDLTGTESDLLIIREPLIVLIFCFTKPLSKVGLSTKNS